MTDMTDTDRARILIVEDVPANRFLLHALLAPAGHQLDDASTLAEARKLLRQHCYDMVLLDLRLPDGSGSELAREIRADPATSDMPVIVISADVPVALAAILSDLDTNEVLEKPLNFKRFREAMDKHLFQRCEN